DQSGKPKKRTVTFGTSRPPFRGPAAMPANSQSTDDLNFALLASGFGYVQVRRSKETLPEQMDTALAKVGDAPGLVLDFRGNSGGGCDHDAFMGRFVPQGKTLEFGNHYASAGPKPYVGPVVVIVDATCVSTGETTSGIFKEDGRGYMIG